ncbi:PAP2-domain-containing protein [Mycena amicta]|nr:PAP2-domain-containing protein [Mycena amicta]
MSWWLYFLDKTNLTVTALIALVIVYSRSAGVAYFASGALSTTLSVKYIVKRIIRQPRPVLSGKKTYGWPSTHASSVSFIAAYISFAAAYLPLHPSLHPATRWFPLVAVPWAALVMLSRIWLGHHTMSQIAAGSIYGILWAWIWVELWRNGLSDYGRVAEELVVEWFE